MIIKKNQDEIQNYLNDASNFKGSCEKIFLPENESDITEIFKEANSSKIQVTVCGNRTGLTGSAIPQKGWLISTEKLNKILEINKKEKFVIVQPAVLLSQLQKEVESLGLFYPPDPTERDSHLGGNVAANSSGAKSFKYGPTRDYVIEMKIILPSGDILKLERGKIFAENFKAILKTESGKVYEIEIPDINMPSTKHAAGYYCKPNMDLIDLFIGSEGTFGIISEIKLKLIELPENVLSCVVFFNDEEDGLKFLTEARTRSFETRKKELLNSIDALGIEYFDYYSLQFMIEEYPKIPDSAKASIWFEQEITSYNEEEILNIWLELIDKHNSNTQTAWIAMNEKDRNEFKDFRHAISEKVIDYVAKNKITKAGTDTAVPHEKFISFYKSAKEYPESVGLKYIVYGHFGDSHIHLNMLPKNENELKKAKNIYGQICELAVKLGGTISAEHGIGKLKRNYLLKMYGEDNIIKMARLKKTFDPNCILGINNIFDEKYLNEI